MLNFIHTKKLNISDQLKLEEHLLRHSDESYCLINDGTSKAVVLGISNDIKALVKNKDLKKDKILLIKRFTAGGCVFVDENTLFITFIFSKKSLDIIFFPESILRWAEKFYKKVFEIENFKLIENDFVIDNKKIAGNAMYIKKDRFLLHTSFLLDFDIEKMKKYLKIPKVAPKYRKNRSHECFLFSISKMFSKEVFVSKIKKVLQKTFLVKPLNILDTKEVEKEYSTKFL
ncbi:MAG: putative lipoate-protein ligase A [Candidatus Anoxychlamydiales bacterium]|nr:putative lipoate-protein ligase A [Candidatus Anoxychlamydiales bacterium]NGX35182.1 putative lipoate-protein ligase A [Candidatus Anoxychlamydiales bacterium]